LNETALYSTRESQDWPYENLPPIASCSEEAGRHAHRNSGAVFFHVPDFLTVVLPVFLAVLLLSLFFSVLLLLLTNFQALEAQRYLAALCLAAIGDFLDFNTSEVLETLKKVLRTCQSVLRSHLGQLPQGKATEPIGDSLVNYLGDRGRES
jgi:hypothetical protein